MAMKLRVGLDEILPSKEAARALPQAIDRLESGDAEHFVITRRNKPRAVLVTIERYQQLLSGRAAPA
jgi:PHD/YefM family antitoxin component YafN of YafNO toxin-antitoxin module